MVSDIILGMWAYAVESKRITIEFVPTIYRSKVREILEVK